MEDITARFNSDVNLYCRLSGEGSMIWERPDGRPLNRAQKYPDGLLRIQNVVLGDAIKKVPISRYSRWRRVNNMPP